ncbi:MAG: branched-chain amino acid ABC transporter permease [Devosia sp.]|nr:branched-chain amino acid ABC transporter permease [Devosia sp.]
MTDLPLPPTSRHAPVVFGRTIVIALVALAVSAPWLTDANALQLGTQFLCLLTVALMWNLLAGYADILSLGQHMFIGVGAYAFYGLAANLSVMPHIAIPLAGIIALLAALPVVFVVFRLRAAYLAVGTWVVAEVFMLVAGRIPGFGLGTGTSLPLSTAKAMGATALDRAVSIYLLALAVALVAWLGTWMLLRSRHGIALMAIRDNEEAASSLGVNLIRTRLGVFLWTAPFLGMVGAITALQKMRISPTASFGFLDWTVFVIFIVVIGGIGSLEGPLIGTIVYFALRYALSDYGTWYLIVLGGVSVAVMLVEPRGLWALLRRWIGEDVIPVSHRAPKQ